MSDWGDQAEDYARTLAGSLGVADFVYHPVTESEGSRNRQIGDGLLVVGDHGLIVQVKARRPESAASDTSGKAESWIRKKSAEAKRQADGTRRRMNAKPATFVSVRGYELLVQPPVEWNAVVLIDYPNPPDELFLDHEPDTMWMTMADWYGLHERLRSTAAVIEYVDRALESGLHPALDQEQERYDFLAAGDSKLASERGTRPRLPPRSLNPSEAADVAFFDEVIDLTHDKVDAYISWQEPDEYRRIVEVLDRIPPGARVDLGRKLKSLFLRSKQSSRWVSSFVYDNTQDLALVIAFDSASNWETPEQFLKQLFALTSVRLGNASDDGFSPRTGLGVGILNHGEDGRSRWYSFIDVSDDPMEVPADIRYELESRFGVFIGGEIVPLPKPGRNERCPCGGDNKYKRCHGSPGRP